MPMPPAAHGPALNGFGPDTSQYFRKHGLTYPFGCHLKPAGNLMETPFVVRDHRTPGQPLQAVPLKLPPDRLEALQAWADRLQCSRGALGRALLVDALDRLEQTTAAEVA